MVYFITPLQSFKIYILRKSQIKIFLLSYSSVAVSSIKRKIILKMFLTYNIWVSVRNINIQINPHNYTSKDDGNQWGGGQFPVDQSKIFESMIHAMNHITNRNTPKNEERERKLSTLQNEEIDMVESLLSITQFPEDHDALENYLPEIVVTPLSIDYSLHQFLHLQNILMLLKNHHHRKMIIFYQFFHDWQIPKIQQMQHQRELSVLHKFHHLFHRLQHFQKALTLN